MSAARPLLALLVAVVVPMTAACSDDGRALRPPRSDQNQTILPPEATSTTTLALGQTTAATPETSTVSSDFVVLAPWTDGAPIPVTHACTGTDRAPAVQWAALPAGTVELAVTLIDLDLGGAVHWAVTGLSPSLSSLDPATLPVGAVQAINFAGGIGYRGPCPPAGTEHRYLLQVWALARSSGVRAGTDGTVVLGALEQARLATAGVVGTFRR
jgi:Raf kinase inhibitor-like YbhB/YbcL family protein